MTVLRDTLRLSAATLALIAAGCGGSGGSGDGGASATEQEVAANTYTTSDQQRPVATGNGQGRTVVAWESFGQDGNHLGVFARRFENGQPVGPEFQANTHTASRQNFPAVAMDGAGNFVIAWRSSLQGSPGGTIFAQRYAADGARLGGEFQVGPDDSDRDSQSEPQIAMNARGDFAIAWSNREVGALAEALGQNNLEERWLEIRTYAADGTPRIAPTRTTTNADDQFPRAPRVAMDANGNFVMIWASASGGTLLRAQHFDISGQALSPAYNVNDVSADIDVDLATVSMTPEGAFAVAWEAYTFGYEPLGIFVRRYSGPQTPQGAQQIVAPASAGLVERNAISLAPNGDLLIAAHANNRVSYAVQTAAGAVRGPERISNSAFPALFPAVARSGDGTAIIVWQSLGQDGDGRGVRVREISLP